MIGFVYFIFVFSINHFVVAYMIKIKKVVVEHNWMYLRNVHFISTPEILRKNTKADIFKHLKSRDEHNNAI